MSEEGPTLERVEVLREEEQSGRWLFQVRLHRAAFGPSVHMVRLSWPDYDVFCPDGSIQPQEVASAVLRVLSARSPPDAALPEVIDAATPRRRWPDADAEIRRAIRCSPP